MRKSSSACGRSPNFSGDTLGERQVTLGVHLGYVGPTVARIEGDVDRLYGPTKHHQCGYHRGEHRGRIARGFGCGKATGSCTIWRSGNARFARVLASGIMATEDSNIGSIRNILVEDEMRSSYLDYAMSVITARALPDVRDGLKPAQRRILVAMNDLNLAPNRGYRKCAKIAGDTSGNYHPHGEAVVYPTLVRLAQPFNMRYPLVDGQGNFGSVDGDPPAAMRYTEARLTPLAMEMLADLEMDTVDMIPNYDGTREEPVVVPGRFPNLLCNGSTGIAVGMATNMPPHNLGEVIDALHHLIDNPEATIDELLQFIKGPDFPTGGLVMGFEKDREGLVVNNIKHAYATGRGRVLIRAKVEFEETSNGRTQLVVTELPYQVNKSMLMERIGELVREKKIEGVSDLNDYSNRNGMRVVMTEGAQQFVGRRVLGHERGRARSECAIEQTGIACEEDDRGRRQFFRQRASNVEAADARHRVIEDDEVGAEAAREGERGRTIGALADDVDLAFVREKRSEAVADGEMVVGDEDADHAPWPPLCCAREDVSTVRAARQRSVPRSGEGGIADGSRAS